MNAAVRQGVLVGLDVATGLIVVGGAWWVFSLLQAQGAMTAVSSESNASAGASDEGVTGALPSDPAAQSGAAQTVTVGDLTAISMDPFANSSNVARF